MQQGAIICSTVKNEIEFPRGRNQDDSCFKHVSDVGATAISDPRPHPSPIGVAAVRELPPDALAFPSATAFFLAPCNCP
jgi:hypothetical protein